MTVNTRQTSKREVFCDASKAVKSVSDRGFAPELTWGAYDTPQDVVNWGVPTIKCYGFSVNKRLLTGVSLRHTSQRQVFCDAWKALKSVFGRGSAPDPAGGGLDAFLDPIVGWGGGHPFPISYPLDAFGASNPLSFPTQPSPPSRGFWIRPCLYTNC